jgi:hypothetical protein
MDFTDSVIQPAFTKHPLCARCVYVCVLASEEHWWPMVLQFGILTLHISSLQLANSTCSSSVCLFFFWKLEFYTITKQCHWWELNIRVPELPCEVQLLSFPPELWKCMVFSQKNKGASLFSSLLWIRMGYDFRMLSWPSKFCNAITSFVWTLTLWPYKRHRRLIRGVIWNNWYYFILLDVSLVLNSLI